jgi:hypothetical protein
MLSGTYRGDALELNASKPTATTLPQLPCMVSARWLLVVATCMAQISS